jgi:hypothetical protein
MSIRVKLEPSDVVVYHVFRDGEVMQGLRDSKLMREG